MMKLDGMLMVGSAGRNVGKTEFACAVIRKFGMATDIVAVKVTPIEVRGGGCPHGGDGCGVCASLKEDYCITEEMEKDSGKDTSRLLAAGAKRVFWLRAMKGHLEEGLAELLVLIGSDSVVICESNSLREVAQPGLFVMVKRLEQKEWKESAIKMQDRVDAMLTFDGGFNFDLDQIKLIDGKWQIEIDATAIVLAGGGSERMGRDKALLDVGGKTMIEHVCGQLEGCFSDIIISSNDAEKFAFTGYKVVADRIADQGPMVAVASVLEVSRTDINFVIACDIPQIDMDFVKSMLSEALRSGADIVIPVTDRGLYEPLFAIYRKSSLGAINKILDEGGLKIIDAYPLCDTKYIKLGNSDGVRNLNTEVEYEKFLGQFEGISDD